MSLQEINKLKNQKGFTIVELLIVIVVIGILAAIVIVAFNGIQNRANTTARNTAAENLAKKIEAFNGVQSAYPAYNTAANLTTALNGVTESSLTGSGITVGTPAAASGNNVVQVRSCTTASPVAGTTVMAGFVIYVWDTTLTTPQLSAAQSGGNGVITNGAAGAPSTGSCSGTASTLTPIS